MKVIAKEYTRIEKELDIEYPFFLHTQDELADDTLIKVFPEYRIVVCFNYYGVEIRQEYNSGYTEHYILNNLTTEEHFNDRFEEALQQLVELKSGL